MISKSLLIATGIAAAMFVASDHRPVYAQNAREAEIIGFHQLCDKGDRRACVRFGILIGENRDVATNGADCIPNGGGMKITGT